MEWLGRVTAASCSDVRASGEEEGSSFLIPGACRAMEGGVVIKVGLFLPVEVRTGFFV
jgi:TolB-like protein